VVSTQTQETSAQTPATTDRRRSARQERMVPAWLSERAGGTGKSAQQQVTVTNLSLHGVGFRSDKKIEPGGAHWIVIATDTLHLSTRLRVVSCRQREDTLFDIGGEFF
jgi:PilZ domain